MRSIVVVFLCFFFQQFSKAETLHIAVASNFVPTIKKIIDRFQQQSRHRIRLSFASSGKLYTQIIHGAPYDIFFSADREKIKQLKKANLVQAGSQKVYARGRLVFWTENTVPDTKFDIKEYILSSNDKIVIANPALAPYGLAASEVLRYYNLWQKLQSRLVKVESVAQAYYLLANKSIRHGFIAYSQYLQSCALEKVSKMCQAMWIVPENTYQAIEQTAIIIKNSGKKKLARAFLDFFNREEIKKLIKEDGYHTDPMSLSTAGF